MDLTFANPAGLFALLALPAVVAIHFFQRRTRREVISTMFLLEDLTRQSERGNVWEKLRVSPLLLLQLLAVLVLTWLLVQPMWLRPESVQQTVVVIDSSISMRAFADRLEAGLRREVNRLAGAAAKSEWTVLESDTTRGTIYRGGDAGALLAAVKTWKPRSSHHDLQPALDLGRSLLRRGGVLLLVSDRRPEGLSADVELLAVGEPVPNCGFAGLRVDTASNRVTWSALVMNHGTTAVTRSYQLDLRGTRSAPQSVVLEPGGVVTVRGELPPGERAAQLVLDPDRFAPDDALPLVVPQPKALTATWSAPDALQPLIERLSASLDAVERDLTGRPDFTLAMLRLGTPPPRDRSGIFIAYAENGGDKLADGSVVADRDPLMAGLNWQGLLIRTAAGALSATNTDRVLLWQGGKPLIFTREDGRTRQLVFNFDAAHANVDRLPAFILLVRRFVERLRADKVAPESRNVELNQLIDLAARPGRDGIELVIDGKTVAQAPAPEDGRLQIRAPDEPGFFEVRQAGRPLLTAAAHFSDTREARFDDAMSESTVSDRSRDLVKRNSRVDMLAPLWLVLLGAVLISTWAVGRK